MFKILFSILFLLSIFNTMLFSNNLKLQEYIEVALKNNPELITSENAYISAKYKAWEAKSMFSPQVSATMSVSRRVSPLSVTFGDTSLFPGLPEKTDVTTYSQGLSAQQNIWDFGRTLSVVTRADLNKELAFLAYEKKKQEIVFNVKKGYYNLMQALSVSNLANINLKEIDNLHKSVSERQKQGLATPIDVLNIESEYMNFKAEAQKAQNNAEIAMLSFSNILGKELEKPIIISEQNFMEPQEYPLDFKSFEDCRQEALMQRIDFKEFEIQEKLSETSLKGAYSEWMPALTASGSYDFQGNTYPPDKDSWSAGVNLSLPLFKGGADYAKTKSAKADLSSIKSFLNQMRRNVLLQLKSSYYKAIEAKSSYESAIKRKEYLEKNNEAINAKFTEGLATITELIEAQTKKLSGEIQAQNALYTYHLALNELKYATGGIK
ncbi:MAG: hypothetical protein A2252_07150 [Elusimicrobia bacterium RIFOXYA2_FULL_39_19]|nr:MAG: hypothetical protein A2252_07150 [Elusimicrobia bacterium RIFOXYA2_FULL_39_19]